MTIQQVVSQIASFMGSDSCVSLWLDALANDPETVFCSVSDFECGVHSAKVWVSIPKLTFTFEEVVLSFRYSTGSSSDATPQMVETVVSGFGTFGFRDRNAIEVTGLSLNGRINVE